MFKSRFSDDSEGIFKHFQHLRSRTFQACLFGLSAVAAATELRILIQPVSGTIPYVFYILPIIGAAGFGGLLPGLLTTACSALVLLFLFLGSHATAFPAAFYFALFLLDGLWISWLGEYACNAVEATAKARRETEDALERERTILNSISDAFGAVDDSWQFTHLNARLAELIGTPLAKLSGQQLWAAWPELSEFREQLERTHTEKTPVRIEVFTPRCAYWHEISAYPQERGLSLFSRDITERKRAEKVLHEAEERLRLAPEAIRAGTWTWEIETKEVFGSPELEHIFGVPAGTLTGTEDAFFALISEEDQVRVRTTIAQAVEEHGQYEVEFRYPRPGGETGWMLARGKVFRHNRVVSIGIDLTEQKKNEEKLLHTQKLESLGVLAGGIAHDFNNLLVAIMGNASLAAESLPGTVNARNQLEEIVLASQKAAHLTRQMLAYAGKGRFIPERLDLSILVRENERLLRSSLLKNVDLRLNLADKLPCVDADSGQMQQVVMNLVVNAAEAIPETEPGTVSVQTSLLRTERELVYPYPPGQPIAAGNYIVLEVRDNGAGMDPATQARIFEPFFTTKFIGRGLGLSAVLGIVRGHKGALKVMSSLGKGTCFQILLPAAQGEENIMDSKDDKVDLRGEGTVLVVDDESCVRNLAQAVLHRYGYLPLAADDGFAALELLRRTKHDVALVVLDLSMPGLTARQTMQFIQARWPRTRILLSSGYGEEEAVSQFRGIPLAGFLQKPYTPSQLAAKVQAALRSGAGDPDPASSSGHNTDTNHRVAISRFAA